MTEDHGLAERVIRKLAESGVGAGTGGVELHRLEGGHSGLTYWLNAGDRRLVVKAVPPGRRPIGRHDMLRQARILLALAGTAVPVPSVVAVDESEPAWFAMSWLDGEAVEPVLDGLARPADLVRSRACTATEVLAALHAVDVSGLAEGAVPQSAADELATWSKVLRAGVADFVEDGVRLAESLGRDVPAPVTPCLVHGDYRLGNVMFAGEAISGVVDWEIWGVGDPRLDLGYFTVFSDPATFPGIGAAAPGLPAADELWQVYSAQAARPVGDAVWFTALGRLKMAAIMSHNLHRHRTGRHLDPAQETLPPTIGALIVGGLRMLSQPTTTTGG
jgi:aminoglycoside phosphotransferase (APT) family kinase protein